MMKLKIKKEVDAYFLKVDVAVRYGDDDMAFNAPGRFVNDWQCIIYLPEKRILDWPTGKTLSFHDMKICDEGIYELRDKDFVIIKRLEGYVPNRLLPGDYGDYLSLDIDENGVITNWLPNANLSDFEDE